MMKKSMNKRYDTTSVLSKDISKLFYIYFFLSRELFLLTVCYQDELKVISDMFYMNDALRLEWDSAKVV